MMQSTFIITPPVYKLQENRQTLLHIILPAIKKSARRSRIFISGECEIRLGVIT